MRETGALAECDMLKRTITGIGLIAVTAAFFLLRKIDTAYFELLVMFLAVVGTYETVRALGGRLSVFQRICTLIFSAALVPCYRLGGLSGAALLYFLLGFFIIAGLVFDSKNSTVEGAGAALFSGFYPAAFLTAILNANALEHNSTVALLLIFVIAPSADTFAYLIGCGLKGPKLCPSISPKKTVSGAVGGLLGGAAASLVLYFIFKNSLVYSGKLPPWLIFVTIGIVAAALTVFGDLAESVIKRKLGVKDMGRILPGHGGVLDRIDGVLFAAVFICACFNFIA